MNLVNKVIKEAEEVKDKKNLFFHGGNLDKMDYQEIIAPKTGRFEYGIGLYLTTSREVAEKYSKGSRKLYLVELENNIVDLNSVKVNINDINNNLKVFLSKPDYQKLQKPLLSTVERTQKEEINLGTLNIIMLNYRILKPKYAADIVKYFISKGADAYVDDNTFGWGEKTVVLFNFQKIKNIQKIDKNDKQYFSL